MECRTCEYWDRGFCSMNRSLENGAGCFRHRETEDYYTDSDGYKHYYGHGREERKNWWGIRGHFD